MTRTYLELRRARFGQSAPEPFARKSAAKRGYGSKWRRLSRLFLRRNPLCVVCGGPATVVDHIVPHRGDRALFWDQDNWQSMCKRDHDRKRE